MNSKTRKTYYYEISITPVDNTPVIEYLIERTSRNEFSSIEHMKEVLCKLCIKYVKGYPAGSIDSKYYFRMWNVCPVNDDGIIAPYVPGSSKCAHIYLCTKVKMNYKLKIFECIATDKGLIFTVETKTKGYVVLKYHSVLNIVTVNYSPLEYKNASALTDKEDKIFEETKKSFLKYLRDNLKTPYAQKVLDYLKAVELAKNGRPAYKS